ncbi:MAG: DnaA/Hda family protein, partial [Paracoccaceae bacterium]
MTDEKWNDIQQNIKSLVGQNNYVNWISPLGFNGVFDGVALFDVPTNFLGNYVDQNFGDLLLAQLGAETPEIRRIRFQVPALGHKSGVGRKPAIPVSGSNGLVAAADRQAQTGLRDDKLPSAPLDKRFTFDNFIVGKPNELAHAAARRVAEGGPVSFNPLFLYGGVGLGKTHLMHAIAWEMQSRQTELSVLYLSAEQFMYR